jgi:CBS domain-containing protein
MQVSEVMTRSVQTITPDESIGQAAKMMADIDAGAIPVGENDRLVGMITDRDIAVRAVAQNKGPDTMVRDVMTPDVKYCFEDEDVDSVVKNMADNQVRRLPVVSRDKRLVGTISLGDIAISAGGGRLAKPRPASPGPAASIRKPEAKTSKGADRRSAPCRIVRTTAAGRICLVHVMRADARGAAEYCQGHPSLCGGRGRYSAFPRSVRGPCDTMSSALPIQPTP